MLNVFVENLGEVVVLRCHGELVHGQENSLLCVALTHYGRDIIVDLAEVDAVDAAGRGALLALQAAGVYMRLRNPSGPVREMLRDNSIESLFEILEHESPPAELSQNEAQFSSRAA